MKSAIDWAQSLFRFEAPRINYLDLCLGAYLYTDAWRCWLETNCPSGKGQSEEANLFRYLQEKRFKQDGYDAVRLMNFDFANNETLFQQVLSLLPLEIIFVSARFSGTQIAILILERNFDLSTSTYSLSKPLDLERYSMLHGHCITKGDLSWLKGISLDCSSKDVRGYQHNFLTSCKKVDLTNAKISQYHLIQFLERFQDSKYLDLSGLCLRGLDLTTLLTNYADKIALADSGRTQDVIIMQGVNSDNMRSEVSALAKLVSYAGFDKWFSKKDCTIEICYFTPTNEAIYLPVNITEILQKLFGNVVNDKRKLFKNDSQAKKIQRFFIDEDDKNAKFLDFTEFDQGRRFLWLCYALENYPKSTLAGTFWQILYPDRMYEKLKDPFGC